MEGGGVPAGLCRPSLLQFSPNSNIQASELSLASACCWNNNRGAACLKPCYKAVLRTFLPLAGLGRDHYQDSGKFRLLPQASGAEKVHGGQRSWGR